MLLKNKKKVDSIKMIEFMMKKPRQFRRNLYKKLKLEGIKWQDYRDIEKGLAEGESFKLD